MNQRESSKWKEFLQIFRHVDILASPYEFNVLESSKSLTAVGIQKKYIKGGIISTAILVLMILYSINIFVKNYNTNVIYAGTQTQSDTQFTLNQNNSVFTLQFQTFDGELLSLSDVQGYNYSIRRYLILDVSLVSGVRFPGQFGLNQTFKQFEVQNCSQKVIDRLNFQSQAFNQRQLDQLSCFKGDYNLFGQNLDQLQSFVKISVSQCQKDCKSQAETANFFSNGPSLQLYHAGLKIKTQLNLTQPAETYPMNTFCNMNNVFNVEEDLYFSPAIIDVRKTFLSILGTDAITTRIFDSSQLTKQDRRYSTRDQQNLCTFNLRYSSDSKYYFAIDQSIILLVLLSISQASGLAIAIIGFIKIIYKIYATHKTFETIMNHVFKFDFASSSDMEQRNKISKTQNVKMTRSQTKKFGQQDIVEVLTQDQQFNFWDNLRIRSYMFFAQFNFTKSCCKRLKKDKLDVYLPYMAQQKIIKDLDLANIVQKLYEIDYLKLYLFDDQQLLLFNSFCYPILNDQLINEQQKQKKQFRRLQKSNTMVFQNLQNNNLKNSHYQTNLPIEDRLSKYSRFFNAQLRFETISELSDAYHKLNSTKNDNDDNKQSSQLIKFINHNKTLIKVVNVMQTNREQNLVIEIKDNPTYSMQLKRPSFLFIQRVTSHQANQSLLNQQNNPIREQLHDNYQIEQDSQIQNLKDIKIRIKQQQIGIDQIKINEIQE